MIMALSTKPLTPKKMGNVIQYCVPSFLLMVSGEIAYSFIQGNVKKVYRINDSINSMCLGVVQNMFGAAVAPFIAGLYIKLYKYRLLNVPNTWKSTFCVMLLADFLYYWAHRLGHQFNWMWAAHSIHHSSENFNYSTALRQAAFQGVTNKWIATFPAALIGVPLNMFEFHASINTAMQFWIHTQYCKNLGPLEYIFNTPAQHIVHHSRSPGYCNKNFGGWFSIWDQLFGTFELNYRPKKFGVIEQHYTWDPLVINLKNYYLLFKRMMRFEGIIPKFKWLFSSARFVSDGGINDINLSKQIRYNPILNNSQNGYCVIMFILIIIEYFIQTTNVKKKGYTTQLLSALYLTLSVSSLSQFMNKSIIGKYTETLKWSLIMSFLAGSKFIGKDKLSLIFDDQTSNIAKFFSCNIGFFIGNMQKNKYKSMLGIGVTGIGLWSIKNAILVPYPKEDDDDQDDINNS